MTVTVRQGDGAVQLWGLAINVLRTDTAAVQVGRRAVPSGAPANCAPCRRRVRDCRTTSGATRRSIKCGCFRNIPGCLMRRVWGTGWRASASKI